MYLRHGPRDRKKLGGRPERSMMTRKLQETALSLEGGQVARQKTATPLPGIPTL